MTEKATKVEQHAPERVEEKKVVPEETKGVKEPQLSVRSLSGLVS